MTEYYMLRGHEVVAVDRDTWQWQSVEERRVAASEIGDVHVSTVFLGIDHGYDGVPLIFETMIFGGNHDGYQERYSTWQEATEGHARAIVLVEQDSWPSTPDA